MTRGMMRTAVLGWSFTVALLGACSVRCWVRIRLMSPIRTGRLRPMQRPEETRWLTSLRLPRGVRSFFCVTVPNAMARTELES